MDSSARMIADADLFVADPQRLRGELPSQCLFPAPLMRADGSVRSPRDDLVWRLPALKASKLCEFLKVDMASRRYVKPFRVGSDIVSGCV